MKPFDSIAIGDLVLIPIYTKKKRLLYTEYAKVLDVITKHSGKKMILAQYDVTKRLYPCEQLEKFWQRCPSDCQFVIKPKKQLY